MHGMGGGCQNALFVMLIQFVAVEFVTKIFPIITKVSIGLGNFCCMCARTVRLTMFESQ